MKPQKKLNLVAAFATLMLLTFLIATLISVQPVKAGEYKGSMYVGMWTEHVLNDDPEYNETNDLVALTMFTPERHFATVATFSNSHYDRSHIVGVGHEFTSDWVDGMKYGVMLAAVHGYEGRIKTHYEDIIFTPITYYQYANLRVTIFGPVVNAGAVFKF
jgi:hypothetical protein